MAQIYYSDPLFAEINLQSPQSDSTPWTLSLQNTHITILNNGKCSNWYRILNLTVTQIQD